MTDVLEDWSSPIMDDIHDFITERLDLIEHAETASAAASAASLPPPKNKASSRSKVEFPALSMFDKQRNKALNSWITHAFNHIHISETGLNKLKRARATDIRSELISLDKAAPTNLRSLKESHFFPTLIRSYIEDKGRQIMRTELNLSGYQFIVDYMFFGEPTSSELEEFKQELHWIIVLLGVIVMTDLQKNDRRDGEVGGSGSGSEATATRRRTRKTAYSAAAATAASSTTTTASSSPTKKIHIQLALTPFIKVLPKSSIDVLGAAHVNSGFSYVMPADSWSYILVFRREEWFKVLIHELFHVFRYELSDIDESGIIEKMKKVFPIKSEFKISESIAEIWATLLNAVFVGYRQSGTRSDDTLLRLEYTLAISRFLIMSEQIFSLFQLTKVLRFMNMRYEDLYMPGDIPTTLRTYMYREDSNVFSYYILKALMLFNVDEFIAWSSVNSVVSTRNAIIPLLKESNDTVQRLFLWIVANYKATAFLTEVEKARKSYLSLETMADDKVRRLATTLRMTLAKW